MINKIKFFTLLSLIILFQSCTSNDNDEYVNMPKSIYEHVATSMNYSYLTYALQKTDLAIVLDASLIAAVLKYPVLKSRYSIVPTITWLRSI